MCMLFDQWYLPTVETNLHIIHHPYTSSFWIKHWNDCYLSPA